MAGIAEALEQPRRKGGTRPLIPQLLATMDPDLRAKAELLLASDRSDRQVAEAFTESGYPCSWGAVDTHRRRQRISRWSKADQ